MAVRNDQVLLFGGYKKELDAGHLFNLHSGVLESLEIVDDQGGPFDRFTRASGVGAVLYLVRGTTVYAVTDW